MFLLWLTPSINKFFSETFPFIIHARKRSSTRPFNHVALTVSELEYGLQASVSIFFPVLVLYDQASVKETVVRQRICEVIGMIIQQYANFALKKWPDDSRV